MKKSKEKKEGSEPVVDLVCYMILYEFDKKKMGFHANCGFEKRKKKKMVPPLSESLTRFTTTVVSP